MPLFSSKAQLTPPASGSKLALADVNLIRGAFKVYPTLSTLQGESVNYFSDGQVVMVSASSQLYQATVFEPDYISVFDYSASFSEFSFAGSGGGSGDITAVLAGDGLSGGSSTGDATLTLNTASAHFINAVNGLTGSSGIFTQVGSTYTTANDLQITGSLSIDNNAPSADMFLVKINGVDKVKVNSEGTFVIKESLTLPSGEKGALAISGSNFFVYL